MSSLVAGDGHLGLDVPCIFFQLGLDTSVLGGIYTRNSGLAYKKIPFFGDLPVRGWFFKNRRENDDRTEILVFITPKITNKAQLSCQTASLFIHLL